RAEITTFLHDSDPALVLEAARAINDEPINGGWRELAALIEKPTIDEALLRRVLNANLHYGTPDTAKALAAFASRGESPEKMRVEAVQELADWPKPSGRDRVIGLWRPTAFKRDEATLRDALQPVLAGILKDAPDSVRIAAARAAGQLNIAQ